MAVEVEKLEKLLKRVKRGDYWNPQDIQWFKDTLLRASYNGVYED